MVHEICSRVEWNVLTVYGDIASGICEHSISVDRVSRSHCKLSLFPSPSPPLPLSLSLPLPPSLSPGFALMLGLASFSRAYHDMKDTHASWSYTVGWIAFLFSLICAAYFILIAVHRMRTPLVSKNTQQSTYTPLAQFEESSASSSEGDEKL